MWSCSSSGTYPRGGHSFSVTRVSDFLDDNQTGHEKGGKTKTYDGSTSTEHWSDVNWQP